MQTSQHHGYIHSKSLDAHIVSRDNILGITNIPGINRGISSVSSSQAKLCPGMLINSKRTCSSSFAFFKTVVLVSHVWRHFKIQADAYKTWQIYTTETWHLPVWQCELDPCHCCYIPSYAHQKIRGGRITNITSQTIFLGFFFVFFFSSNCQARWVISVMCTLYYQEKSLRLQTNFTRPQMSITSYYSGRTMESLPIKALGFPTTSATSE